MARFRPTAFEGLQIFTAVVVWQPFDPRCLCCTPSFVPTEKKRRRLHRGAFRRPVVTLADFDAGPQPLFLLERMAHLRCVQLTICASDEAHLRDASAAIYGSVVEVSCDLVHRRHDELSCAKQPEV